jgi:hypothetical protein
MFPAWRLQLREARLAWRSGRVDEAGALLSAEPLCEFLPAKQLARDVADAIVARARDRFARGDSSAGWNDLAKADRLGGTLESTSELRREYAERVIMEVVAFLASGEAAAASARLDRLARRGMSTEVSRRLRCLADEWQTAERAAKRGHFADADAALARAESLASQTLPEASTMEILRAHLAAERERMTRHAAESQRLTAEIHAALSEERWSAVLASADALLAIAPQHAAASQARSKAWESVGMQVTLPHRGLSSGNRVSLANGGGRHAGRRHGQSPSHPKLNDTRNGAGASEVDTVAGKVQPGRGLLWVDAVGGYLMCFDQAVAIGQPSPGEAVAVPILADISRRHAVIRRDGGAYVLEPVQRVSVDGRAIDGPYVLADNQIIQLGDSVRIRFAKPHALSATARLTLESHHKTQPSADAVLLVADSVVMGPNRHCHVLCRDWEHDVVVYRQSEQLFCRADRPLVLDGVASEGACELSPGARVEGEAFAFAWEVV